MVNVSSSIRLSLVSALVIASSETTSVLSFAVGADSRHQLISTSRRHHHLSPAKRAGCTRTTRLLSSASLSSESGEDDGDSDAEKKVLRGGGDDDTASSQDASSEPTDIVRDAPLWPCGDALDRRLTKIALPCIANFAINPLIGAVDLFWVNRMGNALAVAGQAAANQVFSSAFWLTSVLPSVTATLVSTENAKGNKDGLQDAVCQALFLGVLIAMIGTPLTFFNPTRVLSAVLPDGSRAMAYAQPYLLIRAFAFLPSMISLIGFSAFRGVLDTVTPVKISAFANVFNAILDPILIFTLAMGVPGAALATLAAEVISAVTYLYIMRKKSMIRWSKVFRLPAWNKLKPLLKGGAALQLRNVALNLTFLAVTRVTQSIDETGVSAAAHAMAIQTFNLGGFVLLALSTVAQTVVPNELVVKKDDEGNRISGGVLDCRSLVDRLMAWGFVLGVVLGGLQIGLLPIITRSTPLQEVRDAALVPSILASVFQVMNGLVFIGEGVMVGCGNFLQLSLSTIVATIGCLQALRTFPKMYGVTGVWMSFGVFNSLRLAGVWIHQSRTSRIAWRKIRKMNKANDTIDS